MGELGLLLINSNHLQNQYYTIFIKILKAQKDYQSEEFLNSNIFTYKRLQFNYLFILINIYHSIGLLKNQYQLKIDKNKVKESKT